MKESERTNQRTKDALAELKRKGKKLGLPKNLTSDARLKGLAIRQQIANCNENNRKASALIVSLRTQGKSFYAITKALDSLGFLTLRNKKFQQNQVMALYNRAMKS